MHHTVHILDAPVPI